MRGRTTRVSVQSRHYNKPVSKYITVRDYNYYSVSHLVCIGKQHSIYKVFTAKVGKVAGETKIVRSGSEVITGSFD